MKRGRTFFEDIAGGIVPAGAELDELIQCIEDEFLDFKLRYEQNDKGKRDLRKDVAGLANEEGGVLLIGVREHSTDPIRRTLEPVAGAEVSSMTSWINNVLAPMTSHLSRLPECRPLAHGQGFLLAIIVWRARNLVPVIESGAMVHYRRFGDQTIPLSPSAVADFLLGRRQHASFLVRSERLSFVDSGETFSPRMRLCNLGFLLENDSLVWAKEIEIGVVGWTVILPPAGRPLPSPLRASIIAVPVSQEIGDRPFELVRRVITSIPLTHSRLRPHLPPLGNVSLDAAMFTIPRDQFRALRWRGAFFAIPEGSPPSWFQVDFLIPPVEVRSVVTPGSDVTVSPCWEAVPEVSLSYEG